MNNAKKPYAPGTIRVCNVLRVRPLHFRLPGRSVRLAPGEDVELPAAAVHSQELSRLQRLGSVSISTLSREPGPAVEKTTAKKTTPEKTTAKKTAAKKTAAKKSAAKKTAAKKTAAKKTAARNATDEAAGQQRS